MKSILAVLVLSLTMISPAMAVSENQCRDLKKMAEMIMGARLAGIDILDVIDAMDRIKEKEGTHFLVMSMIESAYSEPAYNVPKLKEQAIKDFGVRYYLACSSVE